MIDCDCNFGSRVDVDPTMVSERPANAVREVVLYRKLSTTPIPVSIPVETCLATDLG